MRLPRPARDIRRAGRLGAAAVRPRRRPSEPTELDQQMMRRALELARRAADRDEAPIGAVVFETKSGTILGEGHNTRESDNDPTHHAEILAIQSAAQVRGDWRLSDCTIAITLEPCPMCAGAIVSARIGRVVYGADDPKAGAARSLYRLLEDPRLNHRAQLLTGVMAGPSAALLREFFRAKRRDSPQAGRAGASPQR